ncbi:restriction endonuclease [Desulfurivibrio sp. C05AmB]|uniref:restriction endonuclease n=1 Tax=Desulfurivibrio sp. C05AmB TaxID=3374371 RepID=UPI00376EC74B
MARKNESLLDVLALFPWWVSVLLSITSYLILKYLIPLIDFQQNGPADMTYVFYKGLANAAPMLAPIVALFILTPAAISAINSWRKRQADYSVHSRKSSTSRKSPLSQQAIRTDSPNDNSFTDSNTLITDIYDTNSLMGDTATIEFNYANYVQGQEVETERVKKKTDLSIETLKKIEWFSFELFCKIYYECIGYRVTKTKAGADGGIDLLLYMEDSAVPYALVQCKARTHRDIGVNHIRELLGVMTSEKIDKGILITNSGFTKEAFEFANAHQIELVDVFKLWMLLEELNAVKKSHLVDFLRSSDFTTPTCPNCEVKLVERIAKKGNEIGQKFWGCKNYPRCHYKLRMNKTGG